MKLVFKIGGSILCPEGKHDSRIIGKYSEFFISLKKRGHELFVVVGGGKLCKNYISAAERFSKDNKLLDQIGIETTRLNAMIFLSSLGDHSFRGVIKDLDELKGAMKSKKILVTGGMKPGQTTDAVAVSIARNVDADMLIIGTDVDGIYDKDPDRHPDSKMFERITPDALADIIRDETFRPGHSAVIDPVAAGLMKKLGIKVLVLDGKDIKNMREAVEGREFAGTTITCE